MNLLKGISPEDTHGLKWLNEPESWATCGEGVAVVPRAHADFFIDPAGLHVRLDAPLLYTDVEGDFVARALVRPGFQTVWDSVVLMVREDDTHWAKLCFEWSDAGDGYKGIVSVVTKGVSDDANGCPVTAEEVWLQLCRVGQTFAMHWSLDAERWIMARLFGLDCCTAVGVGVAGQCPGGPPSRHEIKAFSLERKTVSDIRKGQ